MLNEITAVARRKQGRDWREIADALMLVDPPIALALDLHIAAPALAEDHRLSFYDAMIVAAAIEGECDVLYSEDLQHGGAIGPLTIRTPFIEGAPLTRGPD